MQAGLSEQIDKLDRQLTDTYDSSEIATIYLHAAHLHAKASNVDEACFFMTQAFVFAIDNDDKVIEEQARQFLLDHDRI